MVCVGLADIIVCKKLKKCNSLPPRLNLGQGQVHRQTCEERLPDAAVIPAVNHNNTCHQVSLLKTVLKINLRAEGPSGLGGGKYLQLVKEKERGKRLERRRGPGRALVHGPGLQDRDNAMNGLMVTACEDRRR